MHIIMLLSVYQILYYMNIYVLYYVILYDIHVKYYVILYDIDYKTSFSLKFNHPDMGIVWTLDETSHIIIDRIEALSPASAFPSLVRGTRLLRINTFETKVLLLLLILLQLPIKIMI